MRQQLANLAARIMTEERVTDFHLARRKAAVRMGITQQRQLPSNQEMELALREYQAIFRQDQQPLHLQALRETAIKVMRLVAPFSPRLVGPVLLGTADECAPIQLHLFSDSNEEVGWTLMEHHIPFTTGERTYRFSSEKDIRSQPLYCLTCDESEIEMTVFPEKGVRQSPKGPLNGKPIQRASLSEVEKLLTER